MRRITPGELDVNGVFIGFEAPVEPSSIEALAKYAAQLGFEGPVYEVAPPPPKTPSPSPIKLREYNPVAHPLGEATWAAFTEPLDKSDRRTANLAFTVLNRLSLHYALRPKPRYYEDPKSGIEKPFMKFPQDYLTTPRGSSYVLPKYLRGSRFNNGTEQRAATVVELDRLHPIIEAHVFLAADGAGIKSHNVVAGLLNDLVQTTAT